MKRKDLIKKLREWLGPSGIKYFSKIKNKYGEINAVWVETGYGIPHCVHFIEGMQVRNFLRGHVNWDAHKLDNEWAKLVEEAIK